jgi:formylglycine-generating enzyme required for sulfatase activity
MTKASWDPDGQRRVAGALRHVVCWSALALAACGSMNDSDKNAEGDSNAGSPSSNAGSSASGGSNGSGGAQTRQCTETADPGETVDVPAGEFAMGCNEAVDSACDDDEKPQHTVTLSAFSIDRTEVTQAQYTACVLDGACSPPACEWNCDNTDYPAGCLVSAQAEAYCDWAGKRLPTEAEWEKAARGTEALKYPWGNDDPSCDIANMAGCGTAKAVGSFPSGASPYGALDMAGNVVEMVADRYDAEYYAASPAEDPPGPSSGERYVGRGGGFKSDAKYIRASKRDWYDLTDEGPSLGFRCAR